MEQPAQLVEPSTGGFSTPASPRQAHNLTKQHAPKDAGWSSPVARQAHNLKVAGSYIIHGIGMKQKKYMPLSVVQAISKAKTQKPPY